MMRGGAGNDLIAGGAGADRLFGDAGDDQLEGGEGADRINGGAGFNDIALYWNAAAGVEASLATGKGTAGEAAGDVLIGIENLVGSSFDDALTGNAGDNRLNGRDGNDHLIGGDGNDHLIGGAGMDILDGGAGDDTASYEFAGSGVSLNLATGGYGGRAGGDVYISIEYVTGSDFGDTITGNDGVNRIVGGGGDDVINGAGGNDQLIGGAGADSIDGGAGVDTANYATATASVSLSLATGGTGGEAAGDTFANVEFVLGSAFDDTIAGDNLANRLTGDAGNDTLEGAGGNDVLVGGLGDDFLTGGAGYDVFWFRDPQEGHDVITDFWAGNGMTDRIWLGADTGLTSWAAVQSAWTDTVDGLLLTFANGSALLEGVNALDLRADDFILA